MWNAIVEAKRPWFLSRTILFSLYPKIQNLHELFASGRYDGRETAAAKGVIAKERCIADSCCGGLVLVVLDCS